MHVSLVVIFSALLVSAICSPIPQEFTNSRIVNGFEVDITEIPYQATLQLRLNQGWAHLCGATIISSKILLTAAHCVTTYEVEPTRLRVSVGTSYQSKKGETYDLKRIVVHEYYSQDTLENDIAMLVTKKNIVFHNSVRSIAIASNNSNVPNGTEALVSGFGKISYDGSSSPILLAAKVKIVPRAVCIQAYLSIASISNGMICASGSNPPRDACQGDSGGPLVANNVLIGIVSWGERCADLSYPGVYTKVSEYQSWIVSRAKEYS